MSVKRYQPAPFTERVLHASDDGEYVKYEDYVALEARCAALAAELQSVKAMNDCLSEELRGYESDGAFEGPKMHLLWWQCETPNLDAFWLKFGPVASTNGLRAEMVGGMEQLQRPKGSPPSFAKECSHEHSGHSKHWPRSDGVVIHHVQNRPVVYLHCAKAVG